jgi:hypothetical protein
VSLTGLIVLVHALAGIAFVAGLVGRWIVLAAAARANDLPSMQTLLGVSAPFERIVVIGSGVAGVLGLAAAFAQGRPILGPLQGARVDWVFVSVVLFASLIPLVPLVFLPRGRVFGAALADAQATGTTTPRLLAAFHDPVTRAAHVYELAAVTVIVVLMLAKPF